MTGIIAAKIKFLVMNFTLTFLVIGLLFAAVAVARAPKPLGGALVVEKLLAWYVFFNIGVAYFYNFVVHVFFGAVAAKFIGWADSPFQFEVGTASLALPSSVSSPLSAASICVSPPSSVPAFSRSAPRSATSAK